MHAVHFFVSGRVQGVGYRASLEREARALGLTGWCRNLHDGRVEAFAQGESQALSALLAWARRGPRLAQVQAVNKEEAIPDLNFTSFVRRPDTDADVET